MLCRKLSGVVCSMNITEIPKFQSAPKSQAVPIELPQTHRAVELAQSLIRFPSLSPVNSQLAVQSSEILDYIQEYLSGYGARCKRLPFEGGHAKWNYKVDNLYAEWRFGESPRHLCFIGHTDVVPPGDEADWSQNPFSGQLKNGWIYGRGATDMKGAVAAYCAAITQILPWLEDKSVCLSLILTSDEEWAAINGTKKVLEWLKKNGVEIDAAIVGEPSSSDLLGSHIKVGRRGSVCGELNISGVQGHAAYPDMYDNPNRALSLAAAILSSYCWESNDCYFPPTNFEIVALQSGNFGESAIIPNKANALWNIRFAPQYEIEQIKLILNNALAHPPEWAKHHPDFDKLAKVRIRVNSDTAALPYFSEPGFLAEIAVDAVRKVTNITPDLDGGGGVTDGRFLHDFFPHAQIIELGLPEKGGRNCSEDLKEYGRRGGMHQIDERCLVKDIENLSLCYQKIISQFAASTSKSL